MSIIIQIKAETNLQYSQLVSRNDQCTTIDYSVEKLCNIAHIVGKTIIARRPMRLAESDEKFKWKLLYATRGSLPKSLVAH